MALLAPVGISVYTRLEHFRKSIEALKKNPLAKDTNLVIYSDAASRSEDVEAVKSVRSFANSITGFRTVTIIERSRNYGGVRNAHEAVKQLVKVFKSAIFLEDDIEVAPGFLSFMNSALDYYKDNPSVVSISGYSPPLKIDSFVSKDFYILNRFCGWGCGVYERTVDWLATKISKEEFNTVKDLNLLCAFGDDVLNMVKKEVAGELDAADVRCMFRQAINGVATVYPKYSLVQNNGHDGSGYHCRVTSRFHHEKLWDKVDGFMFDDDIAVDERIRREKKDYREFKGNYLKLRQVNNINQSRLAAELFISRRFERALDDLLSKPRRTCDTSVIVGILSTPRVGSTWLCEMLQSFFGESVLSEWLHTRFLELYLKRFPEATPSDYLDILKCKAFAEQENIGFHIHVNQYIYWLKQHQIDLFDYFNFDAVVYMEREHRFAQVYSYAVASISKLWGREIIDGLNFSESFKVIVSKEHLEKANNAVQREINYFEQFLRKKTDFIISYEKLSVKKWDLINQVFEKELQIKKKVSEHGREKPSNNKSVIDCHNKEQMKNYFDGQWSSANS